MAKLLYEAIKGPDTELLLWNGEQKSFNNIKQALTRAPALGPPRFGKAIHLVHG